MKCLNCNTQADYDKAWGFLVEANKLQRDTYMFNPEVRSFCFSTRKLLSGALLWAIVGNVYTCCT